MSVDIFTCSALPHSFLRIQLAVTTQTMYLFSGRFLNGQLQLLDQLGEHEVLFHHLQHWNIDNKLLNSSTNATPRH